MLNLTTKQIKETLIRLQNYSRWMYFDPSSRPLLESKIVQHKGEKFAIAIKDDGAIAFKMPERKIEIITYWAIGSAPPLKDSIECCTVHYKIENEGIIPEKIKETVVEAIYAFGSSFFIRMIAFCFFSRMQPVTIDGIVRDLSLATDSNEKKEEENSEDTKI